MTDQAAANQNGGNQNGADQNGADQNGSGADPAQGDQRVEDLEFLMRHIEDAFAGVKDAQSDTRRGPDTREAREDRDIDSRGRIHELEELVADLFELMRGWHDRLAREPATRSSRAAPDGLAIVVGHTASAPGAAGQTPPYESSPWQARHEYSWNTQLAEMMLEQAKARGIRAEVFYRDGVGISGAYRKVRNWQPECTLELHFNAASESARGTEVIYGGEGSKAWSETLQAEMVKLYGREGRLNRGIKHYSVTGRGGASLTQIHPSAIIEPFFGSNNSECELSLERKAGLAKALLRAFAHQTDKAWVEYLPGEQPPVAATPAPSQAPPAAMQPPPAEQPAPTVAAIPEVPPAAPTAANPAPSVPSVPVAPSTPVAAAPAKPEAPAMPVAAAPAKPTAPATPVAATAAPASSSAGTNPAAIASSVASVIAAINAPTAPAAPAARKPAIFEDNFWQLALQYPKVAIDFPNLRGITLAQWALECGYGKSQLASEHLNFAGMKWREVMKPYATPVSYEAHDGREDYCKFQTLDMFIRGYWARLDLVSPYDGWRDHTGTPEEFIGFIAETWAPKQNYEEKVVKLYRQLQADGAIPFEPAPVA